MRLFLLVVAATTIPAIASAERLLLRNVTLVTANHPAPVPGRSVLLEGDRIVAILEPGLVVAADTVIDGSGLYLAPGLIDTHVHLGSTAGMRGSDIGQNAGLLKDFRDREPVNYLAFGFTTLIDVSSSPAFVDAWNERAVRPDLHYCLSAPFSNGYGMAFEPMDTRFDAPYFLYDDDQAGLIPAEHDPADHRPGSVAGNIARTDAICIKTYYETGFGGLYDFPVPGAELIRELVAEAHKHGLVVVMHGNSLEAQEFAVATGVDAIAHGLWHWDDLNPKREVEGRVKTLLDRIVAAGIGTQVTAQVIYGERDLLDPEFLANSRLSQVYQADLLEWYGSAEGSWFRKQLEENYKENREIVARFIGHEPTGPIDEATNAAILRLKAAVTYLADSDANIVFGSDTPSSPTFTNPPGLNGLWEIYRLHELGLNERQIFNAITINAARQFGLLHEIGTIEVGKKANLLMLRENPLVSVTAYDQIDTIILGGVAYSPADLALER